MYKSMQLNLIIWFKQSEKIHGPTIDDQTPDEVVQRVRSALSGFSDLHVELDPNLPITAEKL